MDPMTAMIPTMGWTSLMLGAVLMLAGALLLGYRRRVYLFWSQILPSKYMSYSLGYVVAPSILLIFGVIICVASVPSLIH
jgi:hypothetical protein